MRDAKDCLHVADTNNEGGRPRSVSRSSARSEGGSKYTNKDLPHGVGNEKTWRTVFCGTFFEYMGTLTDPWTVEKGFVQEVWDFVYPELEVSVESTGALFSIVRFLLSVSDLLLTTMILPGIPTCVRMARQVCARSTCPVKGPF